MNIAIVEDRDFDADTLFSFIEQYKNHYSLELNLTLYKSGEDFLASAFETYHLVFMDIYLEEIDGVETARRILEHNADCLIVFLTTSKEDIWRAVKIHACFDYIEKSSLNYLSIKFSMEETALSGKGFGILQRKAKGSSAAFQDSISGLPR